MNEETNYGLSTQWNVICTKRDKVLIHTMIWMDLENTRLNERSQS